MFGRRFKFSKWQELWVYKNATKTLKEKTGHSRWSYDSDAKALKINSNNWQYNADTESLIFGAKESRQN